MPKHKPAQILFSDLANEILVHVFQSLHSIRDCLALAATNRHFRSLLATSHRLPILFNAAEAQFGPLHEAVLLVTHNASQPPHLPRASPPQSFALLRQLIEVGRVANKWVTAYPMLKWREDHSAERRFLTEWEQHKLRRACYRIWLFTLAFHTPASPRTLRHSPPFVRSRAALLRAWNSPQLADMLDLQAIFKHVLSSVVCPSNATVLRRHKARYPHDPFPLVAVTQPGKWARDHALYHHRTHFHSTPHQWGFMSPNKSSGNYGMSVEGWGDEIAHYYVLEDMLKLDPGQLMYLYEQLSNDMIGGPTFNPGWSAKGLVDSFVAGVGGEWFDNNGETLTETVLLVVNERGGDGSELQEAIEDGAVGLVTFVE